MRWTARLLIWLLVRLFVGTWLIWLPLLVRRPFVCWPLVVAWSITFVFPSLPAVFGWPTFLVRLHALHAVSFHSLLLALSFLLDPLLDSICCFAKSIEIDAAVFLLRFMKAIEINTVIRTLSSSSFSSSSSLFDASHDISDIKIISVSFLLIIDLNELLDLVATALLRYIVVALLLLLPAIPRALFLFPLLLRMPETSRCMSSLVLSVHDDMISLAIFWFD